MDQLSSDIFWWFMMRTTVLVHVLQDWSGFVFVVELAWSACINMVKIHLKVGSCSWILGTNAFAQYFSHQFDNMPHQEDIPSDLIQWEGRRFPIPTTLGSWQQSIRIGVHWHQLSSCSSWSFHNLRRTFRSPNGQGTVCCSRRCVL